MGVYFPCDKKFDIECGFAKAKATVGTGGTADRRCFLFSSSVRLKSEPYA